MFSSQNSEACTGQIYEQQTNGFPQVDKSLLCEDHIIIAANLVTSSPWTVTLSWLQHA